MRGPILNDIPRAVYYAEKWFLQNRDYPDPATTPMRSYLLPLVGDLDSVHILDVGSGCLPTLAHHHPTVPVFLTSCDILADRYQGFLDRYGVTSTVQCQDMERLSYWSGSFDIVHCSNALDHTPDPIRAVLEMVRVCRPGGWVYLRHIRNVGLKERYHGPHQWNIVETEYKDCRFWNADKDLLLSDYISGFTTVRKKDYPEAVLSHHRRAVVSVYRKPL